MFGGITIRRGWAGRVSARPLARHCGLGARFAAPAAPVFNLGGYRVLMFDSDRGHSVARPVVGPWLASTPPEPRAFAILILGFGGGWPDPR